MKLCDNYVIETYDDNGVIAGIEYKYPDNYNFGYDVVDEMGRLAPNQRAVVWCNVDKEERTFTFGDISRLSSKAANVFRNHGIGRGDKVLVILKRNYEYWYVAPALEKLGAVIIPATNLLNVEDLKYRINAADIKAMVGTPDGDTIKDMLEAAAECPQVEKIFAVRKNAEGTVDFTAEMETASDEFERIETRVTDEMILYFTSGTTGYPKAVIHDHTYSLSHIITAKYWQNVQEDGLHFTIAETGWGKASWGKIYGQWLCGCAVMVYDMHRFTPKSLLRVMEKYKVTSFCAPPTVYRYFVKYGMDKVDLSSLNHLTTAGEALNPEVYDKVLEQTGLKLMEGFGQTETTLMLANFDGMEPKPGSMGIPSPLYNVKVVDSDGEPVPAGQVGEIVVIPEDLHAYQQGIFMGYCDNEELYDDVWRGGMYHTGDTASVDEDGYFWYVGRVDDLIKTRGYRVGPFEIENVIMEHPAVLECAVTGVPHEDRGQVIKATIVLAEGYDDSPELEHDIVHQANGKLASYKWIHVVEFVSEMPKTISGKIRRVEIRQEQNGR
ncbi:MAG: AMP-binding protein [Lentihominibacter sp.]|nr:AMP-binding protein [Lentihominibacter sp.]